MGIFRRQQDGWHQRRHPVEMTTDELADAKRHLTGWHSYHAAELRRLEEQIAHVDMVIRERFQMPMPEAVPVDPWQIRQGDLEAPPIPTAPLPAPSEMDVIQ